MALRRRDVELVRRRRRESISVMALLSILMDTRTTAPSLPTTNRAFIFGPWI